MAKQAEVSEAKPGIIDRVRGFYQEVMAEMMKVTWPSKDELKSHTTVVLILLCIMAAIIYFYDMVFEVVFINLFRRV